MNLPSQNPRFLKNVFFFFSHFSSYFWNNKKQIRIFEGNRMFSIRFYSLFLEFGIFQFQHFLDKYVVKNTKIIEKKKMFFKMKTISFIKHHQQNLQIRIFKNKIISTSYFLFILFVCFYKLF